ncbi:DNA mismatch repair protein MutS [Candidatus Xenohaliotis californiensis]|uniref:DNA mismatch repair protein MutS n=1 Tax=Candidatus Xenohaliotis californiensis TaxID=84677 RepID=A0ABM9N889_9RICK|nr:DNA mismatch repair protein MutS [Candidatus Xenohaliotis californiensis]
MKKGSILEQYTKIASNYSDCILLCRIGEFYEVFGDIAVKISELLNITLTKKGVVPMCGFPSVALMRFVAILLNNNYKIAICEQIDDTIIGKSRLSQREVVRVITPGTVFEEELIESSVANYLMCIKPIMKDMAYALSWADVSTGELCYTSTKKPMEIISIINPSEILIENKEHSIVHNIKCKHTCLFTKVMISIESDECLYEEYNKYFYEMTTMEKDACATIILYMKNIGVPMVLKSPIRVDNADHMFIDSNAIYGLEIFREQLGEKHNTLFALLNKTSTTAGARMLHKWLATPYANFKSINERLNAVDIFYNDMELTTKIRDLLKTCSDLERLLSKINANYITPKDLIFIMHTMNATLLIAGLITKHCSIPNCAKFTNASSLASIFTTLRDPHGFGVQISHKLNDNLNKDYQESGDYIKTVNAPILHAKKEIIRELATQIKILERNYRKISGVKKLSIKNHVKYGYYIEVVANEADRLLSNSKFTHIQTLSNTLRFSTEELCLLERHLRVAYDAAECIEKEIVQDLAAMIKDEISNLYDLAVALSTLDVITTFAKIAKDMNYIRPEILNNNILSIKQARHPVLESKIKCFIPNDIEMNMGSWLVTSPNMSGKSTILRQVALIVIMAQIGSYVPADSAQIGLVDKIFSRIGSSDKIVHGMSTFMVEMTETANIVNNATGKSLVILDEIGRGTCHHDGLAIAMAIIEYLCIVIKCRFMFATHFHELPKIAKHIKNLTYYTIETTCFNENGIKFHYKLKQGYGNKSMGIEIASIAGIPTTIINRAKELIKIT